MDSFNNKIFNWTKVENYFIKFLDSIDGNSPHITKLTRNGSHFITDPEDFYSTSSFVSLTFPDLANVLHLVPIVAEGSDAIELRVDLLKQPQDLGI